MTEIETLPLFPEPERPVLKPARTIAQDARDRRASWTAYTGKRVACDECVIYLHENHGEGPLPRSARKVRTVRATGEQLRLCAGHAEPRRKADDEAAERAAKTGK